MARYAQACERSREAVASMAELDDLTSEVPGRDGTQRFNVRWVLLHMIEETARHAGHADLLREAIDGATGEESPLCVERVARAASALVEGDVTTYLALVHHADDDTLMAPYGGPARHGFDGSNDSVAAMQRFFTSGDAQVEVVQSYASGDRAVVVVVEHQHAVVSGLPRPGLSLRVTWVFRRDGGDWELVHRHADPLVTRRSVEQTAELARG